MQSSYGRVMPGTFQEHEKERAKEKWKEVQSQKLQETTAGIKAWTPLPLKYRAIGGVRIEK